VLVVDSPEVVRRQAVALSRGAFEAIGILIVLIVLLATNIVQQSQQYSVRVRWSS
jgi:hypothetical protein